MGLIGFHPNQTGDVYANGQSSSQSSGKAGELAVHIMDGCQYTLHSCLLSLKNTAATPLSCWKQ